MAKNLHRKIVYQLFNLTKIINNFNNSKPIKLKNRIHGRYCANHKQCSADCSLPHLVRLFATPSVRQVENLKAPCVQAS